MEKILDLFGTGETFAQEQPRNAVCAADFTP
jgi:hypothetical protein